MNFLRKLSGSARGGIGRHAPLESSTGAEASSPHSHFSIDDAFDIPEDDVEANIIGGGGGGGQRLNGSQQRAYVAAGARANGGRRHLSSSGSGAGEVIPEEEDEEEETPIIK